jgi:hypothetical protein
LTATESDFDGSATLVAITVSVPALAGALYMPVLLIVPSTALQVTVLFVEVPVTLAVNGNVPDVIEAAVSGKIETAVICAGAVGFTDTCEEFALSPAKVATETT